MALNGNVSGPLAQMAAGGLFDGGSTMLNLASIKLDAAIRGILPNELVTVVSLKWFGSEALELTYKAASGYQRCQAELDGAILDMFVKG
jgi:hypothetical protein